jgi:hypothetical protein
MRSLSLLAAVVFLAAPLPALACSVASGYRIPTNMELTESADMILLATVTGGTTMDEATDPDTMRIDIRPVAVLKGDPAAAPTTLPIALATDRFALLSNPYDLENAHPLSQIGGCIRYMVPKGSRLLFFLDRHDGLWGPAGGPFSRWAEDVLTDDAPWLAATRLYLDVAALPEADRKPALIARRDALRAKGDDPLAALLADDIDRQLAGPNAPLREELPQPSEDITAEEVEAMADGAMAAAKCAAAAASDAEMKACADR